MDILLLYVVKFRCFSVFTAYIINPLYILVIDLDGTLLDTNYTNLIPYKDVLSNKFRMSYLIELL